MLFHVCSFSLITYVYNVYPFTSPLKMSYNTIMVPDVSFLTFKFTKTNKALVKNYL